jgi:L-amino acid N-acyltransferase YncA
MTTAYAFDDKRDRPQSFDDLPESLTLKRTGESIVFDVYKEEMDSEGLYKIFEEVIVEGKTYPQDSTDRRSFSSYFLSHNCFVFRLSETNQTIAGFYLKPNFPGRSSHIANCGLIVRMDYRSKGLGDLMMERVVRMGRQLGYESLYTNLVFVTNAASIKLCKRYGFVEVGRLPRAGNLKGLGYTDAFQFYKDLRLNLNQV